MRRISWLVAAIAVAIAMMFPTSAQATVSTTYKGWGTVASDAPAADMPWGSGWVVAWQWTGKWTRYWRGVNTSVYITPYTGSWMWTWSQNTGWLVMRTADLNSRVYSKPIYRLYAAGTGDHFYTLSSRERDTALGAYKYEGVAGHAFDESVIGTIPLYRAYQPGTGNHFYTTNLAEVNNAVNTLGMKREGTLAWVYANKVSGTIPLYRLYHAGTVDHLYTTNMAEVASAQLLGYKYEGVACYIMSVSSVV